MKKKKCPSCGKEFELHHSCCDEDGIWVEVFKRYS